jgi:ornithine decarboxylase
LPADATFDAPRPPSPKVEQFLHEIAPATPFIVVDLDVVEERYHQLVHALPRAVVYYAVKANPARQVLERLLGLGSAFDVASPNEIDACLAVGVDPARISYGNTVKKRRDIAYAASVGVRRFTVDAAEELDKVADEAPGSSVCVRLFDEGGGADWPLSRKFGCDGEATARLLARATRAGLGCGVSFHVGSQQRDPDAFADALGRTATVFAAARDSGARPSFLNLGGGFPAHYVEGIPAVSQYGASIERALVEHGFDDLDEIMVEPGRYLVADAGLLRSEVVLVSRRQPDDRQRWVYLDCGKFHGLAETMEEAIRYRMRTPHDGGPTGPVAVAGPTCDSADVLYEKTDYELPLALRDGDLVDLLSAGAYTTTYSSVGFNGFPPLAEYYV